MSRYSQRLILMELAKGAVILCTHVRKGPSVTMNVYRLSTTQNRVREETVRRLLAERLIKPNADGLLGSDGPPQSYSLFRASEGGA